MVSANNYTKGYAEALVLGTPKEQLAKPDEPKRKQGLTREEIAKMEAEMESLERDLKGVEVSYGDNMLNQDLKAKQAAAPVLRAKRNRVVIPDAVSHSGRAIRLDAETLA